MVRAADSDNFLIQHTEFFFERTGELSEWWNIKIL